MEMMSNGKANQKQTAAPEYDVSAEAENRSAGSSDSSSRKDPKIYCNIESMNDISKSPYEPPNSSAEVGESSFDYIKKLLVPPEDENELRAHPEAITLFGPKLAESVILATHHIGKSGILFSSGWQDGKIRGVQCGWIPKPILLLCLHEQRFVRANEAILSTVIRDFGVTKMVSEGIEDLELDLDFLNLSSCNTYTYNRNKTACYKCEIFVARAFRTIKVLKTRLEKDLFESSLWKKVMKCLTVMNEHVRVTPSLLAKRQAEIRAEEEPEIVEKKPLMKAKRVASHHSGRDSKQRQQTRHDHIDSIVGMLWEQHSRTLDLLEALKRERILERERMREEIRQEVREELMREQGQRNGKKRKKRMPVLEQRREQAIQAP
eukprot:scaffold2076_cov106-Cylindrotheca_fusiformis.AAC.3